MVEDSDDDAQLLKRELQRMGFEPEVTRVDSGPTLRTALVERDWDVVISDHNMPGFSGDEALKL
jgi:CheY-like chemotaxis protein